MRVKLSSAIARSTALARCWTISGEGCVHGSSQSTFATPGALFSTPCAGVEKRALRWLVVDFGTVSVRPSEAENPMWKTDR